MNGQITGKISKKDGNIDSDKYLKIDFYNKRDQLMGTEFFDISNVGTEGTEFTVPFKYNDIARYSITTINDIESGYRVRKLIHSDYFGISILILLILLASS